MTVLIEPRSESILRAHLSPFSCLEYINENETLAHALTSPVSLLLSSHLTAAPSPEGGAHSPPSFTWPGPFSFMSRSGPPSLEGGVCAPAGRSRPAPAAAPQRLWLRPLRWRLARVVWAFLLGASRSGEERWRRVWIRRAPYLLLTWIRERARRRAYALFCFLFIILFSHTDIVPVWRKAD